MTGPILVVEDDVTLASALRYYFGRRGYRCLFATDGATALDLIKREPPGIVLLDVMLPGMDGLEVCRRIRADSNLPVIMITARIEAADRAAGLEAGADRYFTKPLRLADLLAQVAILMPLVEPS